MAVVQISRIQVRRGKENSGSGLPQLASGEMAWSIDAQNLWIGNGSVSEGAPKVGNTKILTQNDLGSNGNILDLISYQYKKNDYSIVTGTQGANYPFIRDIQQKLDEVTSVTDFGAVGDGVTDDTAAIQLAINQLFLNSINITNVSSRVTLHFPPGKYIVSATLYIPSYATLTGAGKEKTIIQFNNTNSTPGPVLQFVNDTATPGQPRIGFMPTVQYATYNSVGSAGLSVKLTRTDALAATTGIVPGMVITGTGFSGQTVTEVVDSTTIIVSSAPTAPSGTLAFTAASAPLPTYLNQARSIVIKDMSLYNTVIDQYGIRLDAVRDSEFHNISIKGSWAQTVYETSVGIYLTAVSRLVTCQRNVFNNIDVNDFTYGIVSNNDIQFNTFKSVNASNLYMGVAFGKTSDLASVGQLYGPCFNDIESCLFKDIKRQAIYVYNGYGNTTHSTKLSNVGNNGGSNLTSAAYSQIHFASAGNQSLNDQGDRANDLSTTVPAVSATYNPLGSASTTLVVSSTSGIAAGMVVSGTGFTSSQIVTNVLNSTTLTLSAAPTSIPSGTLVFSIPYYPEVDGIASYASYGIRRVPVTNISSPTFAFRLPLPSDTIGYVIDYVYQGSQKGRRGQVTIMVDVANNRVQLSDEYDYTQVGSSGDETALSFSASISNKSVNVSYTNTSSGDTGQVLYSYRAVL